MDVSLNPLDGFLTNTRISAENYGNFINNIYNTFTDVSFTDVVPRDVVMDAETLNYFEKIDVSRNKIIDEFGWTINDGYKYPDLPSLL